MSATFRVRITPRGGRDAIEGVTAEGMLQVRVAAPPAEGAANRALVKLIADALDVAPSGVRIASGASSRDKRLVVDGRTSAEIERRWPGVETRSR